MRMVGPPAAVVVGRVSWASKDIKEYRWFVASRLDKIGNKSVFETSSLTEIWFYLPEILRASCPKTMVRCL